MDPNFDKIRNVINHVQDEISDLQDDIYARIKYIIDILLTDRNGNAKELTVDDVKNLIKELNFIRDL